MLRVGLAGLIYFKVYCSKKLATPLAFAESQLAVEEGSPSVRRHLLAEQDRQKVSKVIGLPRCIWQAQAGAFDRLKPGARRMGDS
jgi:hypothetical protein